MKIKRKSPPPPAPERNKPHLTAAFGAVLTLALAFTGCSSAGGEAAYEEGEYEKGKGGSQSPKLDFNGVDADGGTAGLSEYPTTALALHFGKVIDGLAESNIELVPGSTGALKGALTGDGPTYTLAVNSITTGGEVTVRVTKANYSSASRAVTVHYGVEDQATTVTFDLEQNGNASTATTEMTLTFDPPIPGLALVTGDEDGIKFNPGETGAKAAGPTTSDEGATYTLAVSGINKNTNVSVTVKKRGYYFDGGFTKSVEVWPEPEPPGEGNEGLGSPIAFASGENSVIDQIAAAKDEASVTITMGTGTEDVQFGVGDLLAAGLVLNDTNSPASVTIDGGGYTVDLTGTPSGNPLITVGNGVTLTLQNIIFKGLKNGGTGDGGDNTRALIRVDTGGRLVLEDGAVISHNNNATNDGDANSNNWGGGVRVEGGTLTMSGGTISDNKAAQAGGVYITNDGTFNMNGGTISGNEVDGSGGGVRIANGTFNMTAGAISGNKGDYSGGGVEVEEEGTFTMTGGKISGNESLRALVYNAANGGKGGGLWVNGGEAIMANNAVIENNTAAGSAGGGGVVIQSSGTFTMRGNAVIRNNTANSGTDSGGVGVWNGTFTMEGGTISGNSVTNGVGGGVYVNNDSGKFSKTGGIIYGSNAGTSLQNTASGGGHAVAVGPVDNPTKKRDNTADGNMSYENGGTISGWD